MAGASFVISWINPDRNLAEKGFDDYLLEGPLATPRFYESLDRLRFPFNSGNDPR